MNTNVGIKFDFKKNCSNFVNMKFMILTLIGVLGLMQCGREIQMQWQRLLRQFR